MQDKILIIDFGSQVTQLIARRVRENGVYSEIHPHTISFEKFLEFAPKGIILSGGPASVMDSDSPQIDQRILQQANVPILGICYGEQLICQSLGGRVVKSEEKESSREFGRAFLDIIDASDLFDDTWKVGRKYQVWMSHGDVVEQLPQGFKAVGKTDDCPFAAIMNDEKKMYGVQFHPEVAHTPEGAKILKNFTHKICGCLGDWDMSFFLDYEIEKIRQKVGSQKVIAAVSGGVDSSVVAALIHKAIGDQITCIFVDTGMLRKNEGEQVKKLFKSHFNIPLVYVDAKAQFLNLLKGVSDPEQKRKIIGKTFIDIFEVEAKKIGGAEFLAQGTLYPDVIESVSVVGKASVVIKSHHNVGGLPEKMNMKLIEPVRELFKDEVRRLGIELGMPEDMIKRHPFPGPGLAIRVLGEIDEEKLDILREADDIYINEIKKAGLYDEIWQAFSVLLPVKTVGVMGDGRTYEYVLALRAVTSTDGMTADYYDFSHEFLKAVSNKITNSVHGVNRIVYDVTSKPPATIEWE